MKERRYTLAEIDRMRRAVEHRCIFGRSPGDPPIRGWGRPYMADEMTRRVEERLRTYMLAGIEPEELEKPTPPQSTPAEDPQQ